MEGDEKGLQERNKGVQSGFGAGTDQKEGKNKEAVQMDIDDGSDQKEGKNKEAAVQMDVDDNVTEIGGSSELGLPRSDKESGKSKVDDQTGPTGDGSELVGSSGCKRRSNSGDQSESVESSGSKNVLKRPQSMTSGLNLSNQRNKTRRTGDGSKAGGAGTNQDIENVEDDDEMEGGVEGNQQNINRVEMMRSNIRWMMGATVLQIGCLERINEEGPPQINQNMNNEISSKLQEDEQITKLMQSVSLNSYDADDEQEAGGDEDSNDDW